MRIMATSDLHGNLEGLDPKGADVVVLAGDIAPLRGRCAVADLGTSMTRRSGSTNTLGTRRGTELPSDWIDYSASHRGFTIRLM